MNPVAAGGVVALAWYREEDGREVPLIRASDLEACQQQLADAEEELDKNWATHQQIIAAEQRAAAAQAEADRLRVDAEGLRELNSDLFVQLGEFSKSLHHDDPYWTEIQGLALRRYELDTAIHAAAEGST